MSKLTKEQWDEIEKQLSGTFGYVKLMVDGYNVSLSIEPIKKLRLAICIYVNGFINFKGDEEHLEIQRRFWSVRKRFVYSAKYRKYAKRQSRATRKMLGSDENQTIEQHLPWFNSFKTLKAHLIKNNESIELIEEPKHGD